MHLCKACGYIGHEFTIRLAAIACPACRGMNIVKVNACEWCATHRLVPEEIADLPPLPIKPWINAHGERLCDDCMWEWLNENMDDVEGMQSLLEAKYDRDFRKFEKDHVLKRCDKCHEETYVQKDSLRWGWTCCFCGTEVIDNGE